MTTSGEGELAVTVSFKRVEPNQIVLYESAYGQMGDHREESLDEGNIREDCDLQSEIHR